MAEVQASRPAASSAAWLEATGGGRLDRVARTHGGRGPSPGPVEIIYPLCERERVGIRRLR